MSLSLILDEMQTGKHEESDSLCDIYIFLFYVFLIH